MTMPAGSTRRSCAASSVPERHSRRHPEQHPDRLRLRRAVRQSRVTIYYFTSPTDFSTSLTRACSSLQELRERVARQVGVVPALLLEDCPSRRSTSPSSRRARSSAFFCAALMPGGATTERQLVSTRSMPCSLKVGTSTPGRRCGERHADGAQLAGLDLAFVFAVAGNAGGDLAAEDRGERLAAAGERHVVDLRRRRAPAAPTNSAAMMWSTPPAEPPAKVTLRDVLLHRRGEVLGVLDRRIRRHDDDLRLFGQAARSASPGRA